MVIEKSGEWGRAVEAGRPPRAIADAAIVHLQDSANAPFPTAGNLHRALGEPAYRGSGTHTLLPVDGLVCTVADGTDVRTVVACADVSVGSWFSRAGLVVVTNVGLWNGLDLTPGSHPNDGRFEVFTIDAGMSFHQRFLARSRARTGSHLPHPGLSRKTRTEVNIMRRGAQTLRIDSVDIGAWTSVAVVIHPDRLSVLV
ncbi:MAG: hypothetical protein ACKOFF_06000 [Acidimicrobiales bacterium]